MPNQNSLAQSGATSIYARVLRDRWDHVPERLRRLHTTLAPDVIRGRFDVTRGSNPGAWFCTWLLNLPRESIGRDVTLTIQPRGESELWTRRFEHKTLITTQHAAGEHLVREQFGIIEFTFELVTEGRTLSHLQRAAALKFARLRIPLPAWLAPRVSGTEEAAPADDEVHVHVEVRVPLFGLLLAYNGSVRFPPPPAV